MGVDEDKYKSLASDSEEKKAELKEKLRQAIKSYQDGMDLYKLRLRACDYVRRAPYAILEKVFRKHMEIIMKWVSKKQGVSLANHVKSVEKNNETGKHELVIPSITKILLMIFGKKMKVFTLRTYSMQQVI